MSETIINPATALATALQELVTTYPTGFEDTATVALTVTDLATGTAHTVEMLPGQASWLTALTMDEITSCRNAHSDGSGECGHCQGRGVVGAVEEPDSYVGEDGLIYFGDGEVDVEASAEMLAQEEPDLNDPGTWQCTECDTVNRPDELECGECGTIRLAE